MAKNETLKMLLLMPLTEKCFGDGLIAEQKVQETKRCT